MGKEAVLLSGFRLDPAVVIGLKVAPAWLKLVAEGPDHVRTECLVVGLEDALTDLVKILVAEFG